MTSQNGTRPSQALTCSQAHTEINDWLDSRQSRMGEALAAHIGACPECRALVRQWNEIELVLRGAAADIVEAPQAVRPQPRRARRPLQLAAVAACVVLLLALLFTTAVRPRTLIAGLRAMAGRGRTWQAPAGNPGAAVEPRDLPMATTP